MKWEIEERERERKGRKVGGSSLADQTLEGALETKGRVVNTRTQVTRLPWKKAFHQ